MATIVERTGKNGVRHYQVQVRLRGHPTLTETTRVQDTHLCALRTHKRPRGYPWTRDCIESTTLASRRGLERP